MIGMNKIPTQGEYENAMEGVEELDTKIVKLCVLNDHQFLCQKSGVWSSEKCVQIFLRETARQPGNAIEGVEELNKKL